MNGEAGSPSRVKRMLPSVSEVLKELTARAAVEPDVAFRAAREVCAEELKRIRDAGGDSVPLEELVQRAYRRVTGQALPGLAAPPAPASEPEPVFETAGEEPFAVAPPPAAEPRAADEPFLETSGALDLRWDEGREPFAGASPAGEAAPPPLLFDEPTRPEERVLPETVGGAPATGEDLPMPFAVPADEPPHLTEPGPEVFPAAPADDGGPGDETLSRLSREAEAIQLHEVFPVPGAGGPPAHEALRAAPAADAAEPPPFEDEEDTVLTVPRGGRRSGGRPRIGLVVGVVAGLAALVGLGYILVGLWMERDAAPAPVAVARPRAGTPAPAAAPVAEAPRAVPPTGAGPVAAPRPGEGPAAATPAPASAVAPAPPPATAPPARPSAGPAATPVAGETAPPPPSPVLAATRAPAAAAVPRSRDGLVVTRDRAGQPQVFSIHFTSYRDRASAERDLKRVEAMVGMKGFVAEVDLGEKGTWQRVMIGTFPTSAEAKAARDELAAKGTRDMGWVYRVVGPEGSTER